MYFCWREIYFLREVFSESLVSDWLLLLAFTRSCRQMLHYHQLAGRSEKQEYTVCNLSIMYNVKCIMYSTSSSVYRYIHCNWGFKAGKSQMYCWRFYKAIYYFFSEKIKFGDWVKQIWSLKKKIYLVGLWNIFVCIGKWFGQIGTESYLDVTRWLHKHFQCHNKYRKIRFHFIIV